MHVLHCSARHDGAPLDASHALLRFAALDLAQLREQGWCVLVHADDLEALRTAWRRGTEAATPFANQLHCRDHQGAYHRCTWTATPLVGPDDGVTQWLVTIVVHEERAALEERAAIEDRAAADERAAHQSMRRRRLISTLAHELRDPLQAMRQATFVLQLPSVSEATRAQMLDVFERQLTRMSGIADAVLELTGLVLHAIPVVRRLVPLRQVVALATAEVEPVLSERSIRLDVSMTDPECEVLVDPERLAHAVGHLLDNAARHSEAGDRVTLHARCHAEGVELTVADSGVGIAPQSLPHMFDMFLRDTPRSQGDSRRLGVGLTLAQHIARLHGGTLEAESDGPGQGSRFRLRLPRHSPND